MDIHIPSLSDAQQGEAFFHDAELKYLRFEASTESVVAGVTNPLSRKSCRTQDFDLEFQGVLKISFEQVGPGVIGGDGNTLPLTDIFHWPEHPEYERWRARLEQLGEMEGGRLYCVLLASSFLRSFEFEGELEGILIVCRDYKVHRVSPSVRIVAA